MFVASSVAAMALPFWVVCVYASVCFMIMCAIKPQHVACWFMTWVISLMLLYKGYFTFITGCG